MSCKGLIDGSRSHSTGGCGPVGESGRFPSAGIYWHGADHATDGRDEAVVLLDAFIKSILILGMLICFALSTLVTMAMNRLFCRKGR